MPKPRRHLSVLFLLPFLLAAQQQKPHPKATDLQGTLTHENTYSNSALGMTIALPRKWQIVDEATRRVIGGGSTSATQDQNCDGPLCDLQIDVSLITKPGQAPVDYISLSAYKVPQRYLDRERYPLKAFAKGMTVDSASGSGWIIDGDLTPIQIDGRPAYRLLAHISDRMVKKKGCMYVGEVNGYVFMLVGTTSYMVNADSSQKLQTALENMKLQVEQRPEAR
ncbi:MAG: hypothetical protein ACXV78_12615 [Candidatus Angelobacter sp.]